VPNDFLGFPHPKAARLVLELRVKARLPARLPDGQITKNKKARSMQMRCGYLHVHLRSEVRKGFRCVLRRYFSGCVFGPVLGQRFFACAVSAFWLVPHVCCHCWVSGFFWAFFCASFSEGTKSSRAVLPPPLGALLRRQGAWPPPGRATPDGCPRACLPGQQCAPVPRRNKRKSPPLAPPVDSSRGLRTSRGMTADLATATAKLNSMQ
jgi:hypothetical protein